MLYFSLRMTGLTAWKGISALTGRGRVFGSCQEEPIIMCCGGLRTVSMPSAMAHSLYSRLRSWPGEARLVVLVHISWRVWKWFALGCYSTPRWEVQSCILNDHYLLQGQSKMTKELSCTTYYLLLLLLRHTIIAAHLWQRWGLLYRTEVQESGSMLALKYITKICMLVNVFLVCLHLISYNLTASKNWKKRNGSKLLRQTKSDPLWIVYDMITGFVCCVYDHIWHNFHIECQSIFYINLHNFKKQEINCPVVISQRQELKKKLNNNVQKTPAVLSKEPEFCLFTSRVATNICGINYYIRDKGFEQLMR